MKRKIFMSFIILCFLMQATVLAESPIKIVVNETEVIFTDQVPVIVNERTMVPVRDVFEALGFTVTWDGATSTATLQDAENTLSISVGKDTLIINNTSLTIETKAEIIEERTMLPLRAVSEALGSEVAWDGVTSTAKIAYTGAKVVITPVTPPVTPPIELPIETPKPVLRYYPNTSDILPDFGAANPTAILDNGYPLGMEDVSQAEIDLLSENNTILINKKEYSYYEVNDSMANSYYQRLEAVGFELMEISTPSEADINESVENFKKYWMTEKGIDENDPVLAGIVEAHRQSIKDAEQRYYLKISGNTAFGVFTTYSGEMQLLGDTYADFYISYLAVSPK